MLGKQEDSYDRGPQRVLDSLPTGEQERRGQSRELGFWGRRCVLMYVPKWGREAGEQCAGSNPELCSHVRSLRKRVEMSRRYLEVWRADLDLEELSVLV